MLPDNNPKIELTIDGQQRRHQMLSELQREVRTTAGQRKKRKSVISHTLLAALIVGLIIVAGTDLWQATQGPSAKQPESNSTRPAPMFPVAEVVVSSQPDVMQKYLVSSNEIDQYSFSFETVDDDSLQQALADAGQETLVAKVDDQLVLWEPN